ncbi:hypothetical protein [Roseimarinus sediminis]|uniref:hypothetical protein n=1 Tax=Roseimarinus sediminis TaxID=1610899 RepID=UPI003D1C183C
MKQTSNILLMTLCLFFLSSFTDSIPIVKTDSIAVKEVIYTRDQIMNVKIEEPLIVKSLETETKDFWFYFSRLGAMIGFLGGLFGLIITGYAINDRWIRGAKVNSKIISFASSDGKFEVMGLYKPEENPEMRYGVRFFLKLSLNVIGKDLNYNNIEVKVKYNKIDSLFTGQIYSPRNYAVWNRDGKNIKLDLPQDRLLFYKTTLQQNATHLEYLTFITYDIDDKIKKTIKGKDLIPEYIQLYFHNSEIDMFRRKSKKTYSNKMTIDQGIEQYIWEDEIWKTI